VSGLQHRVVHTIDHRGIDILPTGCRNQYLLGTPGEVRGCFLFGCEKPRALHDQINPKVCPGQVGRIAIGEHANAVAIDNHVFALHLHIAWETAMRSVVAGEVCIGL